jgi:pimeloyl-ACP methyl ester carboxylesterase
VDAGRDLVGSSALSARVVRAAFGDRPSPVAVKLVAEMGRSMEPAAMVASLSGLLDHDARAALAATRTPSLVVVGTRDLLTPVPAGRHLARLLPDADFVVLPRAGHQLMQERPAELAQLLDAFAAKLAGTAPSVAAAVADEDGALAPDDVEHTAEPADA